MSRYAGKTNAPEFPGGLDWINTDAPLRLKELRGKIVLLDFWTYCCINCMHIIPDLKKLEQKYAAEIVVIGVHSAKFDSERDTQNILQAVMRYEIEHPVVNDNAMRLWGEYGIRAWPSVAVIDPLGKLTGIASGEGVFDSLDPIITEMIAEFDAAGQIDRREFRMKPTAKRMPQTVLSFPGKVLADAASGRLFIADSNHNRIVICSLDGEILDVAGSGETGIADGAFAAATFHHPQGMCLAGGELYVADTENHAIRRLNLNDRSVETVSGNGSQSRRLNTPDAPAKSLRLNSPWDLCLIGNAIYIAMAGPHQLWKLDLGTGVLGVFAGSGREAIVDGPLKEAALAQPSGITTDGARLYFADSETSAIRMATIGPEGEVATLAGRGLFEFGDADGVGDLARFKHPLGVAFHEGVLYIADTYNNKIRKMDLLTREVTSLASGFEEPCGLSIAGNRLFIADTNNHVIKVLDLQSSAFEILKLRGLEKLRMTHGSWNGEAIVVSEPVLLKPGLASVVFDVALPEGYAIHPEAPSRIMFSLNEGSSRQLVQSPKEFPLVWSTAISGNSTLNVFVELYYCQSGEQALCFFKESLFTIHIEVTESSDRQEIRLMYNPLSIS